MDFIDARFADLGGWVKGMMNPGDLRDLLVETIERTAADRGADLVMLEIMAKCGVDPIVRNLIWLAVRLFGWTVS